MTEEFAFDELSPDEVSTLLSGIPTKSVPLKAFLTQEEQIGIFGSEIDLDEFPTLGDIADVAIDAMASETPAFQDFGNQLFGKMSQLLVPE